MPAARGIELPPGTFPKVRPATVRFSVGVNVRAAQGVFRAVHPRRSYLPVSPRRFCERGQR
eukprot:310299-Lingulodinium_polyedra.AAC.1